MLKIKDNVDLEVLKKYGFFDEGYDEFGNEGCTIQWVKDKYGRELPYGIELEYRKMNIFIEQGRLPPDFLLNTALLDLIFDLIKDGLVEKEK